MPLFIIINIIIIRKPTKRAIETSSECTKNIEGNIYTQVIISSVCTQKTHSTFNLSLK